MKRALPILLDTLHILALVVWLGGLICYWAVAVPAVQQAPGMSAASMNAILTGAKHRLDGWFELCAAVLIGMQWAMRRRYQPVRILYVGDAVRTLLTFGAFLLAEMAGSGLHHSAIIRPSGHPNSTLLGLAIGEGALLVGVAALTAWLQLPQVQPTAPAATPARTPPQTPRPAGNAPRKKRARR